jgi:hypothetical protein
MDLVNVLHLMVEWWTGAKGDVHHAVLQYYACKHLQRNEAEQMLIVAHWKLRIGPRAAVCFGKCRRYWSCACCSCSWNNTAAITNTFLLVLNRGSCAYLWPRPAGREACCQEVTMESCC